MKKTRKERIICLGAIIFFATVFPSGDMRGKEAKKKKLYISTVKATGVAGALAERVKQGIKLSIFENYGKDYQILDDEAVKVMYAQAAKIMASGCTDTSCVEQIAEGINADEIIYGSVTSQAGMIKINISNMVRRKSGLDLKSLVSLSFRENQLDHYSREAGKKLINGRYAVKDPLELEDVKGEISLRGIEMQKISGITGVREIDEMGISVLKFSTGDEAAQRVLGYLKGLVQEGDESFRSKKYDDAIEKYKLVTERINSKLRAGSREKIAGFISEIDKRISTSYAMKYKSKMMKYKSMIEKIDPILSRGEWKSARNKWDDILKDMQKNVPAGTPGAVVEVFDGVKRRIEATYVIQFKPEIEKIDRKMKKRGSVSESFLEDMLESYREVGTDLKHVPDNVWGNALYGIKGALSEREDSIIAMMVALRLKKGDAAYREYKFAEALKRYIEAHNLVLSIRDAKRSKELSDACC
jgi:hypothetical protein